MVKRLSLLLLGSTSLFVLACLWAGWFFLDPFRGALAIVSALITTGTIVVIYSRESGASKLYQPALMFAIAGFACYFGVPSAVGASTNLDFMPAITVISALLCIGSSILLAVAGIIDEHLNEARINKS